MQTAEFLHALEELIVLAKQSRTAISRTAIMCAEAVPWRCHRSLVGDALLIRGIVAVDIMSERKSSLHKLTKFAQIDGERIIYPPEAEKGNNDVTTAA